MSTESQEDPKPPQEFNYDEAMRRVIYVVAIGSLVVIAYGFRFDQGTIPKFFGVVTIGLLASGAALLAGGLLGFLFGVPHTRDEGAARPSGEATGGSTPQPGGGGTTDPSTSYRANTSLEQISDWLTKMLVGVGLVEIKVVPGKLKDLAAYIAKGVGNDEPANVFALTILLYFSVCGFVFGFLWARLYLKRWFSEADALDVLGKKISRLEQQQQADARALALIGQLSGDVDDPALPEKEIFARIKAASSSARSQIFAQTQKTSANTDADNYDEKNQSAVCILTGLIKSDTAGRYHRNHSELAYAFRRKDPPEWKSAEKEISEAIKIRDERGKTGWRYYEFFRARCIIGQDPDFAQNKPTSDSSLVQRVLADLRQAYSDSDKWKKWYKPDSTVWKWMELNKIDVTALQQP